MPKKNLMEVVALRIKELRKSKDWTYVQLGEKLGKHYSSVVKWEKATQKPDMEGLEKLAEVFGVEVAYLVTDGPVNVDNYKVISYKNQINILRKLNDTAIAARNLNEQLVKDLYQQIDNMEKEIGSQPESLIS